MNSMDIKEKPTFEVLDGIRLAYQFYAKRGGLFDVLPSDVLGRIIPQIHPRQTVDAWAVDDAVCVGEIKLPYKIYTLDVQDDSLVCFGRKQKCTDIYALHHIDLTHFRSDTLLYSAGHCNARVPALVVCKNVLVFRDGDRELVFWDKNTGKESFKCAKVLDFVCHATLPLCVSIREDWALQIHNLDTGKEELFIYRRGFFGGAQKSEYFLVWHPTKPIFAMSHNGWIKTFRLNGQSERSINSFQGKPCFSYNGDMIWGRDEHALRSIAAVFTPEQVKQERSFKKHDIKDLSVESAGDDCFLAQHISSGELSLHSIEGVEVKPMTCLNGFKKEIYRLPRNHDYRLITIDELADSQDANIVHSMLKIYVPRSYARMEHYCLFKAALKAEETGLDVDWNLFKKIDQLFLQETGQHYAYFKKLMRDKGMLS